MQLADVCQRSVPVWLYSKTTVQFWELTEVGVLLNKFKSQTYDHCLTIIRKQKLAALCRCHSILRELIQNIPKVLNSPFLKQGDQSKQTSQGRGERKHTL